MCVKLSYLHHFMIWSQVLLNPCQTDSLSLFWHFQRKFLSNSCINRTRWFHGGTINIQDFIATFKLKWEKNTNYQQGNCSHFIYSRSKYERSILCWLLLKLCIPSHSFCWNMHLICCKLHYKLTVHCDLCQQIYKISNPGNWLASDCTIIPWFLERREFFHLPPYSDHLWSQSTLLCNEYWGSFSWGK